MSTTQTTDKWVPPEVHGVLETSLYVNDLEVSEKFYRDLFDFELRAKEAGRHVFFRVGDAQMLLLFHAATTLKGDILPGHGSTGPGHVAFAVDRADLPAWRDRFANLQIPIEQEITWPRGGHSVYFRDPDGHSLELATPAVWGLPSGW